MENPRVRGLVVLAAVVALFAYTPTRFFIKLTVVFGIPFILLFGWWRRLRRFSIGWILVGLALGGLLGLYGVQVYAFPERLKVKEITREGDVLLAQGKYDQAINKYREMEKLDADKAEKKVAVAREQKKFYNTYREARELAERGDKERAVKLLGTIPPTAHVHSEAQRLLSRIEEEP